MCIKCYVIRSAGHEIRNPAELLSLLLGNLGIQSEEDEEPKTNAQFIQESIQRIKREQRVQAAALSILEAELKPGHILVGLDSLVAQPMEELEGADPIMTVATYQDTQSGMFTVIGTDHTKSESIEFMVPNERGVKAMQRSVQDALSEPYEKAIQAAQTKAAEADEKAASEDVKSPEAQQAS